MITRQQCDARNAGLVCAFFRLQDYRPGCPGLVITAVMRLHRIN